MSTRCTGAHGHTGRASTTPATRKEPTAVTRKTVRRPNRGEYADITLTKRRRIMYRIFGEKGSMWIEQLVRLWTTRNTSLTVPLISNLPLLPPFPSPPSSSHPPPPSRPHPPRRRRRRRRPRRPLRLCAVFNKAVPHFLILGTPYLTPQISLFFPRSSIIPFTISQPSRPPILSLSPRPAHRGVKATELGPPRPGCAFLTPPVHSRLLSTCRS